MNKIYEIKDILNENEIKRTYKKLLTNNWSINTSYADETFSNMYPTFRVSFEDTIYQPYWFGYFSGLVSAVNSSLKKEKNFDLGTYEIKSIVLNAQNSAGRYHFHEHRDFRYVIVGFLTPNWKDSWVENCR